MGSGEFWHILELEKTPDRHKSIIFDISGRPREPDNNAWRAGLWPTGRMLDTPGLQKTLSQKGTLYVHQILTTLKNFLSGTLGR